MERIRPVPRDEVTSPLVRSMYDYLFGDRDPVAEPGTGDGTPGDWWTVMAVSPAAFEHAVGGILYYQSPERVLDPVHRELAQARIGWAAGSQFVYSQHCRAMRKHGFSEERIAAVAAWAAAECFDATERCVLAYADCLVYDHGRVPDALFDALRAALGDEAVVELTYIATLYLQHAVMTRALRLELDDRDEPVVEADGPAEGPAGLGRPR